METKLNYNLQSHLCQVITIHNIKLIMPITLPLNYFHIPDCPPHSAPPFVDDPLQFNFERRRSVIQELPAITEDQREEEVSDLNTFYSLFRDLPVKSRLTRMTIPSIKGVPATMFWTKKRDRLSWRRETPFR